MLLLFENCAFCILFCLFFKSKSGQREACRGQIAKRLVESELSVSNFYYDFVQSPFG